MRKVYVLYVKPPTSSEAIQTMADSWKSRFEEEFGPLLILRKDIMELNCLGDETGANMATAEFENILNKI